MDEIITDQATAMAALQRAGKNLAKAVKNATDTTSALRDTIVLLRPQGYLTVDEMADAIGRDRNYIDSVWSSFGTTTKGKQTRVNADATQGAKDNARRLLEDVARNQRGTATTVGVLRAERDRVVAVVYAAKILGPSAIAAAVGIDRNHVLRVARKRGINAAWRSADSVRNQHSSKS